MYFVLEYTHQEQLIINVRNNIAETNVFEVVDNRIADIAESF